MRARVCGASSPRTFTICVVVCICEVSGVLRQIEVRSVIVHGSTAPSLLAMPNRQLEVPYVMWVLEPGLDNLV